MEFIRKNIYKLVHFVVIFGLVFFTIFNFVFYNYISEKTYEKKYYLIQEGNTEYLKRSILQDMPVINDNSLKEFSKEAILTLFNYKIHEAEQKINTNRNLFSNSASFNKFKDIFNYRLSEEKDSGFLLKETVISDGPYKLGYLSNNAFTAWRMYLKVKEMRYGENGEIDILDRKIFIIIKTDDFNKLGRGLSVDSITIN